MEGEGSIIADLKVKNMESKTEEKCGLDTISCDDLVNKASDSNGTNNAENGKDDPDSSYVFVSENEAGEVTDLNGNSDSIEIVGSIPDHNGIEEDGGELKVEGSKNGVEELKRDSEADNFDDVVEDERETVKESNGNVVVVDSQPHAEVTSAGAVGTERSDVSVAIEGEPASSGLNGEVKEQTGESTIQVGESHELQVTSTELAQSEQPKDEAIEMNLDGQFLDKEDRTELAQSEQQKEESIETNADCQTADKEGIDVLVQCEQGKEESIETDLDCQSVDKKGMQNGLKLNNNKGVKDDEDVELRDIDIILKEDKDSQIADNEGDINGLILQDKNELKEVSNEAPLEAAKSNFSKELKRELETVTSHPTADVNLEEAETVQSQTSEGNVDVLPAGHGQNSTFKNSANITNQVHPDNKNTVGVAITNDDALTTTLTVDEKVESCPNGQAQESTDSQCVPSDLPALPDDSHPAYATKLENEAADGHSIIGKLHNSTANDAKTEPDSDTTPIVSMEEISASSSCNEEIAGYGDGNNTSVNNPGEETSVNDPLENDSTLNTYLVNPEAESKLETVETDNVLVSSERNLSGIEDDENADNGDQLLDINVNDETCQEPESNDAIHTDDPVTSSQEGSTVDASEGQNADAVRRPFYYMIRIPRYDDESLKAQINDAQLQVNEKTASRDAIRSEIQAARTICREYGDVKDAAIEKEKSARDLLKAKRKEIDAVQSMITRVKTAISVEDIDAKIRNMEHMMNHETLSLKEEKQFIRDIKQLKQIREQQSSTMGNQDEVQEAMDQKGEVEERIKSLRKEADLLRENLSKAEVTTKDAKKKHSDEKDKLNQLQAQFKAADAIRQEAYVHLQSLKKQFYEKNKNFWKYKDDITVANDLALKGEKEDLQQHCINQVERVMELWNNNKEFRKDYVRCNMRSTLRRLRTADGRSLGPDEEPPVIPNVVNDRMTKDNNRVPNSNSQLEKLVVSLKEATQSDIPVEKEKTANKTEEQKIQKAKKKKPAKPTAAPQGIDLQAVLGVDETEESNQEEHIQTVEEREASRKAEEMRREEEAAKLKEKQKLENQAKSKEGMERKRIREQKAREKTLEKERKEAEKKEKDKEKKAKKKDQRKTATDETNSDNEADSAATPVITLAEMPEKPPTTLPKKSQKTQQFTKQSKAKSIPPPLRNRRKKRIQTWMWALLTALVAIALFFLGNSSLLFNIGQQRYEF